MINNNDMMMPNDFVIDGENPADEGGRPVLEVDDLKRKQRCWVCKQCLATNSFVTFLCVLLCFVMFCVLCFLQNF